MDIDLERIAFSDGNDANDITYRRFSSDISSAIVLLENEWQDSSAILGLSPKLGPYLHWVITCAATSLNIATLAMRHNQSVYNDLTVAGPIDPLRQGRSILFDHTVLAELRTEVTDEGEAYNSFLRAMEVGQGDILRRVVLTSGSTGLPKAVPITNDLLNKRIRVAAQQIRWTPDDKVYVTMGRDTAGGHQHCLACLMRGATVLFSRGADTKESARKLLEQSTHCYTVPSFLTAVMTQSQGTLFLGREGRVIYSMGARLESQVSQWCLASLASEVYSVYGSTEVGRVAQVSGLDIVQDSSVVGTIESGVEVEIVNEDGTPVDSDTLGIVRTKSVFMAIGYLGESVSTQFVGGWFYPGDLGKKDKLGRLIIEGRMDDRLSYNGDKFSATDVESRLTAKPAIDDAFVTVIKVNNIERIIVLAVSAIDKSNLRAMVRAEIKAPHFDLMQVANIPRNHMGKIERKRLTKYCQTELRQQLSR
jgi:acyl-coenzyme A synthetase/AMP-(fatty) acid ligase